MFNLGIANGAKVGLRLRLHLMNFSSRFDSRTFISTCYVSYYLLSSYILSTCSFDYAKYLLVALVVALAFSSLGVNIVS